MSLSNYRDKLETYRDLIDLKVSKGKMDIDTAYDLVDKLNEWYEQAKFLSANDRKKGK